MEQYTQKYQFNQEGKNFVVSTGLVDDRIRITCNESESYEERYYSGEFTLDDLRAANQFFVITQSPQEALREINKTIERQKSAVSPGTNDTVNFIGYLVIGTDNDIFTLQLKRDMDPNKYGTFNPPTSAAADLVLPSNYQVDGDRLKSLEMQSNEFQFIQSNIEDDINKLILEINGLRKLTLDLKEENALVKERLRILQRQLEERKGVVTSLINDNEKYKRENADLTNMIKAKEAKIREIQAMQTNVKIKTRPNLSHGKAAVTSKFQESAMRTFLPRATAKQITEDYNGNLIRAQPVGTYNPGEIKNYPVQGYQSAVSNNVLVPQIPQTIAYRTQPQQVVDQKVLPPIYQEQVQPITYAKSQTQNIYSLGQASVPNGIIEKVLEPIYAAPQIISSPAYISDGSLPLAGDNAPDMAYNSKIH